MSDKEFYEAVEKLINQFASQIARVVVDIGLLNTVYTELDKRLKNL